MGGKKKHIYEALVEGARQGLDDEALYNFVLKQHPKASSEKIVHASLLALSDPLLADGTILHVIYALAIRHRLDFLSHGATKLKRTKKEARTSSAAVEQEPASKKASLPLPELRKKRSKKAKG